MVDPLATGLPTPPPDPAADDALAEANLPDRDAYERTGAVLAALQPSQLPSYGLDATHAAGVALRTAPKIRPYREELLLLRR